MEQAEADALLPIIQAMPTPMQIAYLRYLYCIERGEPVYDSCVAMHMELGATKAEAHAVVDRAMGAVRH